jgi:cellulose synthase/poly-beta-1,6-N-acetylglucosamine synthase-like glycosyltransferase
MLDARTIIIELLIIWAVTGATVLHAAVLAWHLLRRPKPAPPAATVEPGTLAFLVPVYNEETTIGPTVESILGQSVRPEQIIVVDDGSTDGTREALRPFEARGVIVVDMPANAGKSRALEAGLAHVQTDLVAMTDADTIVDPRYVEHIKESFRDPEIVAAAGQIESIQHTWITAARQVEYFMTLHLDRAAQSRMGAIYCLPGVSSTYRTEVLRAYGFEHDTIGDDLDLTFRLHKDGRKFVMSDRARVYTSDPPTLGSYARQLRRWYTDVWITARKHRRMIGKGVFGSLEFPLTMLNSVIASVLFLGLPFWFLAFDRPALVHYLVLGTLVDLTVVTATSVVYRRLDVYWSMLSRFPTRFVARFVYLKCMVEVMVGRPGFAWGKQERRSTAEALARVQTR